MARRQGAAGGEGARRRLRPTVAAFHDLETALAAAAAADPARPLHLLTPPGAAAQGGPAYYLEIVRRVAAAHPELAVTGILDCADDAALAHFALAMGWQRLVFAGNAKARARLAALAERSGAEVLRSRPACQS
jgi:hypothetical protein